VWGRARYHRAGICLPSLLIVAGLPVPLRCRALSKAEGRWGFIGGELADFLSPANPNWNKVGSGDTLRVHLKLINDQVTACNSKGCDADIKAYDLGLQHMMAFADILAEGVNKRFHDATWKSEASQSPNPISRARAP
jgi:hypothetical protein